MDFAVHMTQIRCIIVFAGRRREIQGRKGGGESLFYSGLYSNLHHICLFVLRQWCRSFRVKSRYLHRTFSSTEHKFQVIVNQFLKA